MNALRLFQMTLVLGFGVAANVGIAALTRKLALERAIQHHLHALAPPPTSGHAAAPGDIRSQGRGQSRAQPQGRASR
jgi:hypothetical protein